MNADQFYQSRQADWKMLTDLLAISQSGTKQLTPDQIETLSSLYRAVTSDLALAQRDYPKDRVTVYLNQLVAKAHMTLYWQDPFSWKRIIRFITTGLPNTYRQSLPFTLASACFFLLPAIVAAVVLSFQPSTAQWFLPPEVQAQMELIEEQQLWTDIPIEERPYAASFIMTNNIRVSFLAFGAGVLFGIFTVWILIFNGLMLGGLTGLTIHYGIGFDLWTFVIGHGVIELSVIIITGGAGLMLGWALIKPGLLQRKTALVIAAREAVKLVIGLMPFLILAGMIEGFISPNDNIVWPIKWTVGIGAGLLMHAYLLFSGRENKTKNYRT